MGCSLKDERDREDWSSIRAFSVADARAIDARCTADYAIPSLLLMEHAAGQVAAIAQEHLGTVGPDGPVTIVCGPGKNGGDGLAAARHLTNAGHPARIILVAGRDQTATDPDTAAFLAICERLGLPIVTPPGCATEPERDAWAERELAAASPAVIIDAVFGTGLSRPPAGAPAAAIRAINRAATAPSSPPAHVIAVDTPSGLDAETGTVHPACVTAHTTVTFLGPKPGFLTPAARQHLGDIRVRAIGAPPALVTQYGSTLTRAEWDAGRPD